MPATRANSSSVVSAAGFAAPNAPAADDVCLDPGERKARRLRARTPQVRTRTRRRHAQPAVARTARTGHSGPARTRARTEAPPVGTTPIGKRTLAGTHWVRDPVSGASDHADRAAGGVCGELFAKRVRRHAASPEIVLGTWGSAPRRGRRCRLPGRADRLQDGLHRAPRGHIHGRTAGKRRVDQPHLHLTCGKPGATRRVRRARPAEGPR
jgi:hypothetical protein